MDIMELGAIGELVGGVAVLVTLIYLAVQVRQGNQTRQRESYRAWASELNKVLLDPQRDPAFVELFQQANRDWSSLSPRDQGVVSSVYSEIMILCQEAFSQAQKGDIDANLSHQIDAVIATFLQMPGPVKWWSIIASTFYSPAFCKHVDGLLASESCPPPMHHVLPWYVGEAEFPSNAAEGA